MSACCKSWPAYQADPAGGILPGRVNQLETAALESAPTFVLPGNLRGCAVLEQFRKAAVQHDVEGLGPIKLCSVFSFHMQSTTDRQSAGVSAMAAKPASAPTSRMRTIYLPSALNDDVYSTLQSSIRGSRDEDLVVDATYLAVMDPRLLALLRSAMLALNGDHHSLTVVKSEGAGAPPTPVIVPGLGAA